MAQGWNTELEIVEFARVAQYPSRDVHCKT
jgi:hypothetical protein